MWDNCIFFIWALLIFNIGVHFFLPHKLSNKIMGIMHKRKSKINEIIFYIHMFLNLFAAGFSGEKIL